MRYRKLDENGDYTFGGQQADFHHDTPEAVAQAVKTRLQLLRGEWFLDTEDGMPWGSEVLGERTIPTRDSAIKKRVLDTPGVTQIDSYESTFDPDIRALVVVMTISTIYGTITLNESL